MQGLILLGLLLLLLLPSTPGANSQILVPVVNEKTSLAQLIINEQVCDASHLLVIATLDGHIHGMNAATGSMLWRVEDDSWGPLVKVSNPVFKASKKARLTVSTTDTVRSALPYPSNAQFPSSADEEDYEDENEDNGDDEEDGTGESFVNLGTFVPEASGDGQLYQLSADNVLKVKHHSPKHATLII
jgi:hypothetical protein